MKSKESVNMPNENIQKSNKTSGDLCGRTMCFVA